jgi:hypothetical protein
MWRIYFDEALYNTLHPHCPPLPLNTKPLLRKGTKLEAKTKFGFLQIESLDDQTRRYRWRVAPSENWNEETVKLKGQSNNRNLLYPGNRCEDIPTLLGLRHNVMSFEGDQNCKTQADLDYWLRNYGLTHGAIYTQTGFLVGFRPANPGFEVVQLELNGEKPKNLPGAQDASITISTK